MAGKLKLVGLTGGIGSGKSTVGRLVAERGIPLIDADRLAREVVAPGEPALAQIAAAWPDVIRDDGSLDRRRLGQIIFRDPAARRQLEAITHPRTQERLEQEVAALATAGHHLVFYEASLLVETQRFDRFDALVVVTASQEDQVSRTMARDGSSREEVLARIAAQLPLAEKRKVATHVIDNSGSLEATARQVDRLIAELSGVVGRSQAPA